MVPESELQIDFSHSSGPGGQNVNKTATKATARWRVGDSAAFTTEQKERIRQALGNRLTKNDEIVVSAEAECSQWQNKTQALERLQNLVSRALARKKPRRPTKPTRSSRERRLVSKEKHSRLKTERQSELAE